MNDKEIEKAAYHLAGLLPPHLDKEEYFQIAFLEGLEARERGANVYGAMKAKVGHESSLSDCPVSLPSSGAVHSAVAKLKRGEPPTTPQEKSVAYALGNVEEIIPITIITEDTPESLLIDKQNMEKLQDFLKYDTLYLTPKQRDAIGVLYFGRPTKEEFSDAYGTGYESIRWHSQVALDKLRRAIF